MFEYLQFVSSYCYVWNHPSINFVLPTSPWVVVGNWLLFPEVIGTEGGVHPDQKASSSQGHIHTNKTELFNLSFTPKANLELNILTGMFLVSGRSPDRKEKNPINIREKTQKSWDFKPAIFLLWNTELPSKTSQREQGILRHMNGGSDFLHIISFKEGGSVSKQ